MDDTMIDLTAGDAMLRRRLEAYADARLTPDLTTSSRLRARVLAVAHRQAELVRADAAALTVIHGAPAGVRPVAHPAGTRGGTVARARHGARRRRAWAVVLAATLGLAAMSGTALAAGPGGPLYETRVWVETLTLPTDPADRALAELDRLDARLAEAAAAHDAGDAVGAGAALTAYASILETATANALTADDAVAGAVLQAGMAHNVEVLQGLALRLPEAAGPGIERAIDQSDHAVDAIATAKPGQDGGSDGGPPANGGGPAATPAGPDTTPKPKPTKAPTPEPAVTAEPTPKPTRTATPEPTPKATKTPAPDPTPKATKTPKPDPTPRRTPDPGPPDDAGSGAESAPGASGPGSGGG